MKYGKIKQDAMENNNNNKYLSLDESERPLPDINWGQEENANKTKGTRRYESMYNSPAARKEGRE